MNEDAIEQLCLEILQELGWQYVHGPDLLPEEPGDRAEREDERQVLLLDRLRPRLVQINGHLPSSAIEDAIQQLDTLAGPNLVQTNLIFHRMLTEGIDVTFQDDSGETRTDKCILIDWVNPDDNDLLAVNQFTVKQGQHHRRPDVVLFVNGLPLVVIELKSAVDEQATLKKAWQQLQTYHAQIGRLHQYNGLEVISDGLQAKYGTLSAGLQHFSRWPVLENGERITEGAPEMETLVRGLLKPQRLLSMVQDNITFEDSKGEPIKMVAKYHQALAVDAAVDSTLRAVGGDRRAGVVWHTQGAGKSLEMVLYAARISRHPQMENPTLVVLTDRMDLDSQLFGTFSGCEQLLRQQPQQAESRAQLQELLKVPSGGIVFTTIQKFFPESRGEVYPTLSERRNIVVIADEAHRSQYDFIDGFARHMRDALPKASFIGFTGTPIDRIDASTQAVFGDYVHVYDIQQAVEDGATVPLYYEARLARIGLDNSLLPAIDEEFEEVTEEVSFQGKEQLKKKWSALEALVGNDERLRLVAEDLVSHFETRQEALDGKAMIVTMSRKVAVDLYQKLIQLRPDWHSEDDDEGVLKIVMTGSASDPLDWQSHIRNKPRRTALANRFKDPDSGFKIVIVRDMWLTGFDAPSLHTMYVDKPMKGHGLMQAIARVNRVFRDKPGGLVVDYIGIAQNLREAVATYSNAGGQGTPYQDTDEAVALLQEKLEILQAMIHGFDWSAWLGQDVAAKLAVMADGADHVLGLDDGDKRWKQHVSEMSKAFALCASTDEAIAVRDEVAYYQAVRSQIIKASASSPGQDEEINAAVKQLVDAAVQPEGVVDVLADAGLDRPDLSILSDEFLEDLCESPRQNLAMATLQRLLEGQTRQLRRRNLVQAKAFSDRLEAALLRYQNRSIEAAEVLSELVKLAKDIRVAAQRGDSMGLEDDELAFYDALVDNPSALAEMEDDTLKKIAQELVEAVRNNVTVDWSIRESSQAKMRVIVKRLLRKYGYPPDAQKSAVKLVLQQAELFGDHVDDAA